MSGIFFLPPLVSFAACSRVNITPANRLRRRLPQSPPPDFRADLHQWQCNGKLLVRSLSVRVLVSTLSDPATLSPLLFCIYLNDLSCVSRDSNLESYVHDSKVIMPFPLCEIDAAIKNLEQDLHRVENCCCENHLLII
jgi:hypothetical protein